MTENISGKQKISLSSGSLLIIILCFLCNILDGIDVLIISYTAPVIAKAWNISAASLGIVFSSGLVGMTIGAIFIAPFSDKIGRRPLMLFAAALMGICIYATSYTQNINQLMLFRFMSGLGIGTMMANTTTLTAEYAPAHTKAFWVSLVVAGYPAGAVLTGLLSASVISKYGWQALYIGAGILTLAMLPVLFFLLKESKEFKERAKPKEASVKRLFTVEFRQGTIYLWAALFLSFSCLYFLMNWIPKLASNTGLSMEKAIYAGMIFNLGALAGIPTQGFLSIRFGLKRTISAILLITAIFLITFGLFRGSDLILLMLFLSGFGIQSGFVGLYAMAAGMYPVQFRSTGIGWAMGMGRLGGIVGPILGGILVSMGFNMFESFAIFAIPSALAGLLTWKITSKSAS